jgi:hypothetical protein
LVKTFRNIVRLARAARTLSAARGDFNTSRVAISARLDALDSQGNVAGK